MHISIAPTPVTDPNAQSTIHSNGRLKPMKLVTPITTPSMTPSDTPAVTPFKHKLTFSSKSPTPVKRQKVSKGHEVDWQKNNENEPQHASSNSDDAINSDNLGEWLRAAFEELNIFKRKMADVIKDFRFQRLSLNCTKETNGLKLNMQSLSLIERWNNSIQQQWTELIELLQNEKNQQISCFVAMDGLTTYHNSATFDLVKQSEPKQTYHSYDNALQLIREYEHSSEQFKDLSQQTNQLFNKIEAQMSKHSECLRHAFDGTTDGIELRLIELKTIYLQLQISNCSN